MIDRDSKKECIINNISFCFFVIFILGQFFVGLIGWYIFDLRKYNIFPFLIILPFFKSLIVMSYCLFSTLYLYKCLSKYLSKFIGTINVCFILFYFSSIYTYSYHFSFTPITYVSSFIYNGFKHQVWNKSLIEYENTLFLGSLGEKNAK